MLRSSCALALAFSVVALACVGVDPVVSSPVVDDAGTPDAGVDAAEATSDATLFVDPAKGDDSGLGTSAAPLKTLKKALSLAKPGSTVNLAAGTYSVGSGEDFEEMTVPANVTITTAEKGAAVLAGVSGKTGLSVPSGARLVNLAFESFDTAINATGGKLTLVGVTVAKSPYALFALAKSTVEATECTFRETTGQSTTISVQGEAKVTLIKPTFVGLNVNSAIEATGKSEVSVSEAQMSASAAGFVSVRENARAVVSVAKVTGSATGAELLYADGSSSLTVQNATLTDNGRGLRVIGPASLSITDTEVSRNGLTGVSVEGPATFKARRSKFIDQTQNNVFVNDFSRGLPVVDLGTPADIGGNTFSFKAGNNGASLFLNVTSSTNSTLGFAGNLWNPAPAPSGNVAVAGTPVVLAPHYELRGSGYTVSF